jgi:hypothetical protein
MEMRGSLQERILAEIDEIIPNGAKQLRLPNTLTINKS